jgi:hypothetical protein
LLSMVFRPTRLGSPAMTLRRPILRTNSTLSSQVAPNSLSITSACAGDISACMLRSNELGIMSKLD